MSGDAGARPVGWHGTIIVADPEPAARAELLRKLRHLPWDTVGVAGPAPVIHEVHRNEPFGSVVLARFDPEIMEPQRLAQRLAAFPRGSSYLVYLVNEHDDKIIADAYAAGADDVLVLPLFPIELGARLRHAWQYLELESLHEQIGQNGALMAEMATATVVHSRNYLESELNREVERSRRYGHALGVILAEASMQYGPAEGALRASGRYLLDLLRKDIDWLARYTQSSFAMVLPETNVSSACSAASRISRMIRGANLESAGVPCRTTWKFGVTAINRITGSDNPSARVLLDRAEEYLAAARVSRDSVAGGDATLRANAHF